VITLGDIFVFIFYLAGRMEQSHSEIPCGAHNTLPWQPQSVYLVNAAACCTDVSKQTHQGAYHTIKARMLAIGAMPPVLAETCNKWA